jgi:hypothetical protein
VEQRCEEVGVADCDGELDQDILVPEHALLETAPVSTRVSSWRGADLPLGGELALLVGGHKCGGQAICAQVQSALRAPAHIVDQGHCPLVELVLVVELVLDGVEVDEVAHARARVPAHVVGVHIHFPEELDHLVAVCDVLLGPGSAGGEVGSLVILVVVVAVAGVDVRDCGLREGKRICDFEHAVLFHAHQAARGQGREGLSARSGDLDCDLCTVVRIASPHIPPFSCAPRTQWRGWRGAFAQSVRTRASTCTDLNATSLRASAMISSVGGYVRVVGGAVTLGVVGVVKQNDFEWQERQDSRLSKRTTLNTI